MKSNMYEQLRKTQKVEDDRLYFLMQELKAILKEKKSRTRIERILHWISNNKPQTKPAVWKDDEAAILYDKS
ncbi:MULTISPECIES: hypothetical protein [unclassified Paenibacillus]|uniref:hypothetical protein n=1 Tax=unclassified Paenibacillus TaxID=185978 RepID=UPI001AE109F4|nr:MULTISPECIES: hypothetical protein [unclassified Paenibacillus]MBP1156062.1 antibiotic biosynthesis monooxygenase (ABM) superfamily enzyme [Paenibacillus sp. PvP091]MBP1168552.1 antibiotic biosynthesis monooxygenase (ABM) superfamily enzyme [Paenibacillus sp. PvR098]MBP2439580.1 antibiotic biosynthesis monooxygenase (ABM) superfamily enzyme [Paenibacillus sp. PvP052]